MNVVGQESALGPVVSGTLTGVLAEDKTAPKVASTSGCAGASVNVNFNEPMDPDTVEVASNYTSSEAGITFTTASQTTTQQVKLTASANLTCLGGKTVTVGVAVKDANGNPIVAGSNDSKAY